jgi:hypothetical protein
MGVITVQGPISGRPYSINISGDAPTPTEQARIDEYLTQSEAPYAAMSERLFGETQGDPLAEDPEPEGGFGTAVGMGVDQLQKAYGSTLEGIGSISGLKSLQNYGESVIDANEQQIAEKAQALTRREDIDSVGDALSFYAETLGQQVPQLGVSLSGAYAGAKVGGVIGGVPGAVAGGLIGGALANFPYFFGSNALAQKDAIDRGLRVEMNYGAAALTAIPQAALDSIVDRLLIGKVLNPKIISSGGIFTRAAKGVGAGTIAEVPTEIGQEVLNRYQAGLPIGDEEALKVYEDVAIAAGLTGGTVRGATNIIGGDIGAKIDEEEKFKQIGEDAVEDAARTQENINRIKESEQREDEDITVDPLAEQQRLDRIKELATGKYTPSLPAPMPQETDRLSPQEEMITLGQAAREATLPFNPVPMSQIPLNERQLIQRTRRAQGTDETAPATLDELRRIVGENAATREASKQKPVSSGTARYQPVENKSFTQDQFDRAVQEIKAQKKYTFPAIQKAVRATGVSRVPRSMVLDIRDEMVNRGYLRRSDKAANGYAVEPDVESVSDEIASYRKTVSDLTKQIETSKRERVGVLEESRRADQVENNPRKARELNLRADEIESQIGQAEQAIAETEDRIARGPQSTMLPTTERPSGVVSRAKMAVEVDSPQSEGQIDALRQTVVNYDAEIKAQKKNLAQLKRQSKKVNLPRLEQGVISEIEADIEQKTYLKEAAEARLAAPSSPVQVAPEKAQGSVARKVANRAVNTTRKTAFNDQRQRVFNALRQRLNKLGLPDVQLTAEKVIAPELLQDASPRFAEGAFTATEANTKHNIPANRIIALSMETADPSKSAQEQFDILKSVMNHEVIHALKNLGVFSDAEWNSLTKFAANRKYVHIKNGKPVERKYTYLDRAKSMYQGMGLNDASIEEEAIAEVFRDYADGKIKVAGRPRTLLERIKNFFNAIFRANQDAGFNSVEDIFDNVKSGNIGRRERVIADPTDTVEAQSRAYSIKQFSPVLPVAPEGTRSHQLPHELLIRGNGTEPIVSITQKYAPTNAAENNSSIEQIIQNNPDALMSVDGWMKAMQEGLGGDFIPAPPLVAIEYSRNPQAMADKLAKLTPELRKGVDEGFKFVDQIRDIYESGQATPRMTLDLFVWGILSRGAGPVQQEGAFIDVIDSAYPLLEKATREPLTEDDVDRWMTTVSSVIPEGSPGKQVTMNVNAAAKLIKGMSQYVGDTGRTVLDVMHEGMSDPNVSAANIREAFMSSEAGQIDNKVVSFILLVSGKDDVLVMDRIQGRHLWDDGRYGGANIYDGINGKAKDGLNKVVKGPVGNLMTRLLENGMRKNVQKAYELAGRPQDASLGRWHWETWVIEGEQVVNHGTLQAVINGSPIGTSVTEGKTDTFSSGMTYIRGENATVVEYPLSDGGVVYMSPVRFKDFTSELAKDAGRKNSKTKVFKSGNFKVTARADIPWFERKEVDREALDNLAREYQNAKPNGSILRGDERVGEGKDASRRGNSPIDRRYSLGFLRTEGVRSEPQGGRRGRDQTGRLAPLEGAPTVEGAAGPDENLVLVAEQYARENGIDLRRQSEFVVVDETRAGRIAQAYEDMENAPQDPEVQEAYQNLIAQTKAQYDALIDNGYEFTFFDANTDPYDGNPWNAMRDLRANKRMAVYGTYDGYGTEGITQRELDDNPMLQDTGLRWKDQNGVERPVTANDLFRAVHDAFGHGLEGAGFRARGEENAWQAHVRLFTGSAIPAITSETRGQNSWLNYGPFGETNRTAQLEDTVFAEQKTGLMPAFTWQEGIAGSVEPTIEEEFEGASIVDNLPASDRSSIEQLLEGQPMTSKTSFSVAPANPNELVAAPVKNKDGSTTPVFGSIMDRGKLIPVVLPAGEHTVFEQDRRTTEAGRGLYHIKQRGHERELMRFSKYKKAENAMYDLLRRWQNQGYEDGTDVIGYPSRGGFVLEWKNNIPFSAPSMQLVLKPRKMGSGYVYDIQTFFPDLAKKDRAIVDGRTRYSVAAATDSAAFFDDAALRQAANQNDRSREILSTMPIQNFLSAALSGRSVEKESAIEQLLRSGEKFESVPMLYVRNNGDGTGTVSGHEGRHRARALENLGYTEMPVRIISQGGDGPAIRWGQQNNISSFDYVPPEQRPSVLIGEDGDTVPMPDVTYSTPNNRYSLAPVQYSMNTLAGQVQQKEIDINYARASDFIAKGLGVVMPKDRAQAKADTILRKFQDNMLPVGRMIQELKAEGLNITDAMDTYLREELYHGVVGNEVTARQETIYKDAVDAVSEINITEAQMNQLKALSDANAKGAKGFVSQALETARSNRSVVADAYLYAKHAKERNAYVRSINPNNDSGSGMTDAEANAILTWFSGLDTQNSISLGKLDRSVRAIVQDTNQVRRDSGLIPDDFGEIELEDGTVVQRSDYSDYVPLRGKIDPENEVTDPSRPPRGAPFGARGREDPRITGRYDYAESILETTMVQNQNSIARGERNKVGQSFLELLRADPEKTKGYATILDALPKKEVVQGRKVMLKTDTMAYLDPFIYTVKENGKDVYVRLEDENVAKALKGDDGVGAGALAPVVRGMGKINRYLSNINTSYNPEFFITNLLRDLQTAGVNIGQYEEKGLTKQIIKDVASALKGIKRSIRDGDDSSEWSKYYKDFVDAGGQNATNQMNTVQDQMDNVRSLLGEISDQGLQGKWNSVKNSFIGKKTGSLFNMIENYNTIVENGIRVATYKAMLDRGFSRDRAAQAARNVTVNFAKGGEYKQFMNAFYLFYNASLQGSFALLNAALKSKKVQRMWAGVIAAGLLQDQINGLVSGEDEDGRKIYDKIPPYILEHNLILMDPFNTFSDRGYIAIPMPYGLNMAHNIGRATSQALRGGTSPAKATSSIVGTIVDTINPLGGTESFVNFVSPTVLDPFVDVLENEDFSKKPIYKEGYPGDMTPNSQKYWSTTNPSAIWVSNMLNDMTGGTASMSGFVDLNPDVMNFWLEYATGGAGRFVQRAAELPFRVYEEGLTEEIIREVPFVRKALGSVSEREDYGSFVEKREKILVVGNELRDAIKTGDRERLQTARTKYAEEVALLPRIKAIDNAIRKVSRQINQVKDNKRLPDSQRDLLIERLSERKQMLIARGNMMMKDYQ